MALQPNIGIANVNPDRKPKRKKDEDLILPTVKRKDNVYGVQGVTKPVASSVPELPKPTVLPGTTAPKIEPLKEEVKVETPVDEKVVLGELFTPETSKVETPVETQQVQVEQGPSILDREQALIDAKTQGVIRNLNAAFEATKRGLETQRQALDPQFRGAIADVRTADTMQRAADEKSLAIQGLSSSGARTQSDISQNVITGGQMSALRQQRIDMENEINAKIADAEALLATGIQNAQDQALYERMQNEINALKQEEANLKAEEEKEFLTYIETIGRFANDYAAEIQRVRNDGDPSNDWQLPYLEAARQDKVTGMTADSQRAQDDAYNKALNKWDMGFVLTPEEQQLIGAPSSTKPRQVTSSGGGFTQNQRYDNAMDKWERGWELTPEEQQLIGAPSAINPNPGGKTATTESRFDDKTISTSIDNAINSAKSAIEKDEIRNRFGALLSPAIKFTPNDEKEAVKRWIIENADNISEVQGNDIIQKWNLDVDEIARMMQGGISPGGQ